MDFCFREAAQYTIHRKYDITEKLLWTNAVPEPGQDEPAQ